MYVVEVGFEYGEVYFFKCRSDIDYVLKDLRRLLKKLDIGKVEDIMIRKEDE